MEADDDSDVVGCIALSTGPNKDNETFFVSGELIAFSDDGLAFCLLVDPVPRASIGFNASKAGMVGSVV